MNQARRRAGKPSGGVPAAAVITGLGGCLPPRVVDNDELAGRLDTSDEWIRSRTGIASRRWVDPGVSTADLAVAAGRGALESAGHRSADLVILATSTPDRRIPATAPEVAWRLGLEAVPAFDLDAACAGFVYALALASAQVEAAVFERVLVIGADTYSTILDRRDRNTAVLFGDGAGAVLLCAGRAGQSGELFVSRLGSDGAGSGLVAVAAGGSRLPESPADADRGLRYLRVEGKETYRNAVQRMSEVTAELIRDMGWSADEVQALVAHQANQRILDTVAARLGLSADRCVGNIRDVGNTAAASVPLALADAAARRAVRAGARTVLTAFGGGLAWGAVALTWPAALPVMHLPALQEAPVEGGGHYALP
ncbi:beta-ketoacyl-ACP synthase III [Streptomyces sp. NPDC020799]|uniref:beta-ketoacyl-ACP synthase III n=1 Tax=Streptomyces sp. NPDC020799 TaxID=3365091 RepID=UPI0037B980C4